jgi:hypothetical protein
MVARVYNSQNFNTFCTMEVMTNSIISLRTITVSDLTHCSLVEVCCLLPRLTNDLMLHDSWCWSWNLLIIANLECPSSSETPLLDLPEHFENLKNYKYAEFFEILLCLLFVCLDYPLLLKMEVVRSSKTFVNFYRKVVLLTVTEYKILHHFLYVEHMKLLSIQKWPKNLVHHHHYQVRHRLRTLSHSGGNPPSFSRTSYICATNFFVGLCVLKCFHMPAGRWHTYCGVLSSGFLVRWIVMHMVLLGILS